MPHSSRISIGHDSHSFSTAPLLRGYYGQVMCESMARCHLLLETARGRPRWYLMCVVCHLICRKRRAALDSGDRSSPRRGSGKRRTRSVQLRFAYDERGQAPSSVRDRSERLVFSKPTRIEKKWGERERERARAGCDRIQSCVNWWTGELCGGARAERRLTIVKSKESLLNDISGLMSRGARNPGGGGW